MSELPHNPSLPWTVERVREELPDVTVDWAGVVTIHGKAVGRQNRFARVYDGNRYVGEWSWEAVARSLNTGRPLKT